MKKNDFSPRNGYGCPRNKCTECKVKSLMVSLGLLLSFAAFAQEYKVKVKLNNPENYQLRMAYFVDDNVVIDSNAVAENGWMVFKGKVEEPIVANMFMPGNPALSISVQGGVIPGPYLNFFLTNEEIEITGDANTIYAAKVVGGQANKDWVKIKDEETALEGQSWEAIKRAYSNMTDTALMQAASQSYMEISNKRLELQKKFIAENPNSLVSMYFLSGMINSMPFEELNAAYDKQADVYKQVSYGRELGKKIEVMQQTAIGNSAIPINKKDINGNPITLETLKGKYVLLDFWGSWCGPCRASHPHMKELYAKYKDKGFEILGIAFERSKDLEDSKKSWKKAIEEDGMTWIQVLNNEDQEIFDAVKAYGVNAFPTKLLLDKEGKIIARYVGENKELDEKLKEIFGD